MTKMEKMTGSFWLTGDYVRAIKKDLHKVVVKFTGEPHKEKNEKYGNYSYHAPVSVPEIEILEKDEETGRVTKFGKATGSMIDMTWNMNGKTSDFLSEKFGGDTADFVKKEVEIDTVKVSTKEGMKDSIYPVEMLEEAE